MKNYNVNGAGHGNEQYVFSTEIVTPIHTSNHYRQFEDLYLKTLVGGDRNMEQHDLIVSADGKTWDETYRNTSYLFTTKSISNTGFHTHFSAKIAHTGYYLESFISSPNL